MPKRLFYILVAALVTVSCIDDDNGPDRPDASIADLAGNTNDLSILAEALERTDLLEDLDSPGSFTVLAPTNAAFTTFLENNDFADVNAVPQATLRQLLLNHVIIQEFRIDNLVGQVGYLQTSASGPVENVTLNMLVNGNDGIRFNNGAQIIQNGRDLIASNGTVHMVDAVIELPTLPDFIVGNPGFSDLLTALTTATPSVDFVTILSESGLYTVFAPSNEAFDALFQDNPDWSTVEDIDEDALNAVLSHHVIGGPNILSADIENGEESPATLEGDTLQFFFTGDNTIRIEDGTGDDDSTILVANIQASNGVIHVISQVLIPNTEN
ncbi:MAG: fasciclin domain-containing protein [Bacteroidota bacterium]